MFCLKQIASLTWNKISTPPAIYKQYIPSDCPIINELQLAEKSNDCLLLGIAYQETLLQIKSRDQVII